MCVKYVVAAASHTQQGSYVRSAFNETLPKMGRPGALAGPSGCSNSIVAGKGEIARQVFGGVPLKDGIERDPGLRLTACSFQGDFDG